MTVQDGKRVSIEYTLKLDDGSTVDSNVGQSPLTYEQGEGQILPALEQALSGLDVNESKQVTLSPDDGYGRADPDALRSVPLDALPEDGRKVGTQLMSRDDQGQRVLLRVHAIEDEQAVLDLNHPLAGETLHFDVRVVGVE